LLVIEFLQARISCSKKGYEKSESGSQTRSALQDVARRAVAAIGFDHGLFNVELFYRPRDGASR
jgi:hypothetical protein